MMRSLYAAISGLRNHQTKMDVIGNNIANVNTVGFKSGSVTFQDMLSQTLSGASSGQGNSGGTNAMQVGLGVSVASINTNFTDGSTQSTGVQTDLAITGQGFFVVGDALNQQYTRSGNFTFDALGNFVNGNGVKVLGWQANSSGVVDTTGPIAGITVPVGSSMPAKVSSTLSVIGNLSASANPYGTAAQRAAAALAKTTADANKVTADTNSATASANNTLAITAKTAADAAKSSADIAKQSAIDAKTAADAASAAATAGTLTAAILSTAQAAALKAKNDALTAKNDAATAATAATAAAAVGSDVDALAAQTAANNAYTAANTANTNMAALTLTSTAAAFSLVATVDAVAAVTDTGNASTAASTAAGTAAITASNAASAASAAATVAANAKAAVATADAAVKAANDKSSDQPASLNVYDTQGNAYKLSGTFEKTGANVWTFTPAATITDGNGVVVANVTTSATSIDLTFDALGKLQTSTPGTITINPAGGPYSGAGAFSITPDFSTMTQYGTDTTAKMDSTDGYTAGTLNAGGGITIASDGTIIGSFTNGKKMNLGQVAMATFNNPGGLIKSGDSLYTTSSNSGQAQVGKAGTGGRGKLTPGSLEMSNVDLAQQFSDMIVTQRGFQANSKIITTDDSMLEELVNLKR